MRRGEVWWADLPAPAGRRPVVLLSRDSAYAVRLAVTVAPVSTRIRGLPVEVPLGPADGLPQVCAANLDDITTVNKDILQRRITSLRPDKLQAVDSAILFALGLES